MDKTLLLKEIVTRLGENLSVLDNLFLVREPSTGGWLRLLTRSATVPDGVPKREGGG